jgi:hypothetical protein
MAPNAIRFNDTSEVASNLTCRRQHDSISDEAEHQADGDNVRLHIFCISNTCCDHCEIDFFHFDSRESTTMAAADMALSGVLGVVAGARISIDFRTFRHFENRKVLSDKRFYWISFPCLGQRNSIKGLTFFEGLRGGGLMISRSNIFGVLSAEFSIPRHGLEVRIQRIRSALSRIAGAFIFTNDF